MSKAVLSPRTLAARYPATPMPEYRIVTEIAPGNRETQMVELPGPPGAGQVVTIDGRDWEVVGPHLIYEEGELRPSIDPAWLCRPA